MFCHSSNGFLFHNTKFSRTDVYTTVQILNSNYTYKDSHYKQWESILYILGWIKYERDFFFKFFFLFDIKKIQVQVIFPHIPLLSKHIFPSE
jgi:hypothetical protein